MMSLPDLIEVQARSGFRLWLKYSDGTQGAVDLSDHVGRGVFKVWETPGEFEKVRLGASGDVVWNDQLDLCPDSLYFKITGIDAEEFLARSKAVNA